MHLKYSNFILLIQQKLSIQPTPENRILALCSDHKFSVKYMAISLLLLVSTATIAAQTCHDDIPASTPNSRFTVHNNNTVSDLKTGLMWQQTVAPGVYSWKAALEYAQNADFAAYDDWRLPNIKELGSIVELKCYNPSINASIFPNTPASDFWSSSALLGNLSTAWGVYFNDGNAYTSFRSNPDSLRLVRN